MPCTLPAPVCRSKRPEPRSHACDWCSGYGYLPDISGGLLPCPDCCPHGGPVNAPHVPVTNPARCPDCGESRGWFVDEAAVRELCLFCVRYGEEADPRVMAGIDKRMTLLNQRLETALRLAADILAEDERTDELPADDHDAVASVRWWLDAVLFDGAAGRLYRATPTAVVHAA